MKDSLEKEYKFVLQTIRKNKKILKYKNPAFCEDCEDCPLHEHGKECNINVDELIRIAYEKLGYNFFSSKRAVEYFNINLCGVFLYLFYKLLKLDQRMEIE
jgi:hypothetical protein